MCWFGNVQHDINTLLVLAYMDTWTVSESGAMLSTINLAVRVTGPVVCYVVTPVQWEWFAECVNYVTTIQVCVYICMPWNVQLNTAVFLYSMLLLMLSKNWKYILNVVWVWMFLCVIHWQRFANGMDLYSLELFSVRDNEVAADVLR